MLYYCVLKQDCLFWLSKTTCFNFKGSAFCPCNTVMAKNVNRFSWNLKWRLSYLVQLQNYVPMWKFFLSHFYFNMAVHIYSNYFVYVLFWFNSRRRLFWYLTVLQLATVYLKIVSLLVNCFSCKSKTVGPMKFLIPYTRHIT